MPSRGSGRQERGLPSLFLFSPKVSSIRFPLSVPVGGIEKLPTVRYRNSKLLVSRGACRKMCTSVPLSTSFKERSSFGVKNPRTAHFLYTLRLLVRAILPLIERFGDSTVSYPWSSALSCPSGPSVQRQSACRARVCTTLESETGDRTLS